MSIITTYIIADPIPSTLPVSFEYLEYTDVKVTIEGEPFVLVRADFVTDSLISTSRMSLSVGDEVIIKRITSIESGIIDFTSTADVTAENLDTAFNQIRYAVEEAGLGLTDETTIEVTQTQGVPIGTELVGEWATVPSGCLAYDGAQYPKNAYPALWVHAQAQGLVLTKAAYDAELAAKGAVAKYGEDGEFFYMPVQVHVTVPIDGATLGTISEGFRDKAAGNYGKVHKMFCVKAYDTYTDPIAAVTDPIVQQLKDDLVALDTDLRRQMSDLEDDIDESIGTISTGFIGQICAYYGALDGSNRVPGAEDWALCDGAIYSGTQTPDLRGRFIVGEGSGYSYNNTGGASSVTLSVSQIPSHTHTVTDTYIAQGTTGGFSSADFNGMYLTSASRTSSSVGGGSSHENNPPYRALRWVMKVQ